MVRTQRVVAGVKNEILGNRFEHLPTIYEGINMIDLIRVDEQGNVNLCMIFDLDYNFLVIPNTVWERCND